VHFKHLEHMFVSDIIQRQKQAGLSEPIVNFMCSLLATTDDNDMQVRHNEEDSEQGDGKADVCACMCCYYWVARRKKQTLVPLPMQNLLWFVRTLIGSEKKKCDSRILLRLVKTIIQEGNMYAVFFEPCELQGMRRIVEIAAQEASRTCVQGNATFCVKKHLAQLWNMNNGQSFLLPHRQATDLLR
jgi:hypothetical protein